MAVNGRAYHESRTNQAEALRRFRDGQTIADFQWRRLFPGSRIAPVVDKLRNGHGFDIAGNGSADEPYYMTQPNQAVSRVEVTDAIKKGYYETEHWHETRRQRMDRDNRECVLCGVVDDLCVHHVIYNLFAESMRELMTVCHDCHETIHKDSRLKFPPGVSVTHANLIGVPYVIEPWLQPRTTGMLF